MNLCVFLTQVTYEWRFGYVLMFVAAFVLVAYCVFKIVR